MAGYTCYSTTSQGCGSFHRLLSKSEACCKVHAQKHDEHRTPVRINSVEDLTDYPASAEAQTRKDTWLATRKDRRTRYDAADGGGMSSEAAPSGDPAPKGNPGGVNLVFGQLTPAV